MLTYHDVMTTKFSLLGKAATKWDEAAKKFESAQKTYDAKVKSLSTGGSWNGQSAIAAQPVSVVTSGQYTAAAKEARAIASILRDAQDQFVELRTKLKTAVEDAVKAGMKVSEDGIARYDYDKASEADANAARHDPDMHTVEDKWTQHISKAVEAFDHTDQYVKIALKQAVQDPDPLDGVSHGFNNKALGDIEAVEGKRATHLATQLNSEDGNLSPKERAELERLLRNNEGDKTFSQTFLNGLGPKGTITFNNKLNGLAKGDDKQDYLAIQEGLANSVASATRNPKDPFYNTWRQGLRKVGAENIGSNTNPLYGYQSFVDLMTHGKDYGKQFFNDLGDDLIATEKDHPDIWTTWGAGHKGIASDPLDSMLGIMSKQPDASTAFFDPAGKNDHLKYLLDDRDWPKMATSHPGGIYTMDNPASRLGLGAALEAAATGERPGTEHTLGGHSAAEARVMQNTINLLNSEGAGDKLHMNLRAPLGNMLSDYTVDTHEILSRTNEDYKSRFDEGQQGGVWKDEKGVVRMAVDKNDLVRVMRGVANDPAAYAGMYNAERQYAADYLTSTEFNKPQDRLAAINSASSVYGFYDGISSDIVFDKRDEGIQWARDVNHHVTSSSGALLNFIPSEIAPGVSMPAGVPVGGDLVNRMVDFGMYDWTKDQIAEANKVAGEDNRQVFDTGQRQVDNLVLEWGKKNGHPDGNEPIMKNLVGAGQERHDSAREEAFRALDRDK